MLELGYVRANLDRVRQALASRGATGKALDEFEAFDKERREAITEAEQLKAKRNQSNAEVGKLKKEGKDASHLFAEMKEVSGRIKELDKRAGELDNRMQEFLLTIPNIPHESVPAGKDETGNREEKTWGKKPKFDFDPKAHWDLGTALGILDFERAAKITGARFVVYQGMGARLERALTNFMLDVHTQEHGYREVLPPFIVNTESLTGTAQLPKFADDLFKLEGTDYWLIPTAEVPVTNLHRDETLGPEQLPVKYVAWTPCFRSEAGSHGKDTRGIVRQHQFQKVELVKFSLPEKSYEELESLLSDAETILQRLELPYRVITLCTGDMGFAAAKTYDIEVWLPGQGGYKEISSCTNFESFQARRAGIRYRMKGKGKSGYVHTLNGSGLAIGRTWMAILENHQQADGTVLIPKALRPYLDGKERLEPEKTL